MQQTTKMTPRQRYLAALRFEQPDRVPFEPGYGRRSTLRTWHQQGLPAHVTDYQAYLRQLLGIEPSPPAGPWAHHGVVLTMMPEFEEKVLERRPALGNQPGLRGTLIVQDWKGNVCEISDEFDPTYLRNAPDFVTRTWVRCPVESRHDWPDMARRYDAEDPRRLPIDFAARGAMLRERNDISGLTFPGPFWQLREWLGFEPLCMLMLDDPAFAEQMIDFWRYFVARVLERVFEHHVPDYVMINEDMAYKEKPMISPAMCRRFLLPTWRVWGEQCRSAGVPLFMMDSDGHVGELIPVWIDGGFQVNAPQEVAAGNDLPAYHQRFGREMAYMGGVDKRAMAAGGSILQAEIDRLRPAIEGGGYIPGCDHGVPPDVSWPNFVNYARLLAQATGWL